MIDAANYPHLTNNKKACLKSKLKEVRTSTGWTSSQLVLNYQ